jgi:sec-independent protein translocase protein TatB
MSLPATSFAVCLIPTHYAAAPASLRLATFGVGDTLLIVVVALIVFGPKKLPEISRQLGKLVFEFRKASNDFKFQIEEELRSAEQAERQKQLAAQAAAPQPATPVAMTAADTVSAETVSAEVAANDPAANGVVTENTILPPTIQPPASGLPVAGQRPYRPTPAELPAGTESSDEMAADARQAVRASEAAELTQAAVPSPPVPTAHG